jgi:hypothetical protein
MSPSKFDWIRQVKSVEREFLATRFAVDQLLEAIHVAPGAMADGLRCRDLQRSSEKLEATYIIRMFAEFEAGLRSFWTAARRRKSPARTRDLLEGVGATVRVPNDHVSRAHAVREFRNSLIHGGDTAQKVVTIAEARRCLCLFMSFLPLRW